MTMRKFTYILAFVFAALMVQSCKKETENYADPYSDGKSPLGIEISRTVAPVPAEGDPGTSVTFQAKGLVPYKDKLVFMFNGEVAEVTAVTETSITVKVPDFGSSGVTTIAVDDQLVVGPRFTVNGIIKIDPSFKATSGTNNYVNTVYKLVDGRNLVLGAFTNYNNSGTITPLNRIVRTSSDGELDRTFRARKGSNGQLSSIVELSSRFYIAGGFSGYDQRNDNISNITSISTNGSVDTVGIKCYRRITVQNPSTDTLKYFPRFNGGTNSYISRVYKHQSKILATGNFRYYVKRTYGGPNKDFSRDTVVVDSTEIRQILRFNTDGSLDKTYRFNTATNKGSVSANGPIDTYMHEDAALLEKLVVFGQFTTFDSKAAKNIVRLNADGSIDEGFKTGAGFDGNVLSLTYNTVTKKYLVTGAFRNYDGKPAGGIALLNSDGTLDETFVAKSFDYYANISRQLDNGLIVVSGSFKKYGGVTRSGFMVLTPTGDLAPGYNPTNSRVTARPLSSFT